VLRMLIVLLLCSGIVFHPDPGAARKLDWTPALNASGAIEDCAEACHSWLIEDRTRAVAVDIPTPFSGGTRRVQYAADWIHGEACPKGRVEIARRIAGYHAFIQPLLDKGFCPRATLDGVLNDVPYLTSLSWNDVVFDADRHSSTPLPTSGDMLTVASPGRRAFWRAMF